VTKRAVIFDFGGVFVDSPFTAMTDAANARDLDPDRTMLAIFGDYAADTDHPWHRLERGEITVVEARDAIVDASQREMGVAVDPFEFLAALSGGGLRDDMIDFVKDLRGRGLATGLLTNNAKEFQEFWRPLMPLDELFDDVIDSSEVGIRKPDRRIYELALERLGVTAEEAVFVDDAPGNIAGAEVVGIAGVLIGTDRSDVPAAIAAIDALVV
jgi:putative hydrolase of the HAD superfamily